MPFQGEKAGYKPVRRIMVSKKVQSLLRRLKKSVPDTEEETPLSSEDIKADAKGKAPTIALAIDGSYHPTPVENNYPGAELGYLTAASVLIFLDKIKASNEDGIINPVKFRAASETGSLDMAIPGRNLLLEGEKSGKNSMRKILFEEMQEYSVFEDSEETLLDTYQHLAGIMGGKGRTCPCENEQSYQYRNGEYKCENRVDGEICGKSLYSTDGLGIHELFSDIDSCDKMYGQIMNVIERLLLVHILRIFEKRGKDWLSLIGRMAFIVDGPLAIHGTSAPISDAFRKELDRINKVQKEATGLDMLIVGIEKSGRFAHHLEMLDRHKNGQQGKLPADYYHLLDNDYIQQHIAPSDGKKQYGVKTYFGRKLFYRASRSHLLVVNMACYSDQQRNLETAEPWQYPRLNDAFKLLDDLSSNMYPNSISPLIAAHAEASIPLHLGRKILDKYAKTEISSS